MIFHIIFWIILITLILFSIFIFILKIKIEQLEKKIESIFQTKNNLIPALYEVTKKDLVKHEQVFYELLKLKKLDFSEQAFYNAIHKTIYTQQKIHKEMDFIFRLCHKHKKLIQNNRFFYTKELLFERITELWKYIKLYKKIVKKYNRLISIKNYSIIWLIIPIQKKEEI